MTRSNPMEASAPLPTKDTPIDWQNPGLIHNELLRAQTELMHAIEKHRRAWAKVQHMKGLADLKGNSYYMDNDRNWQVATGEVTWWRGEMSARSNVVVALTRLLEYMDLDLGPSWAETTSFGDGNQRAFVRGGRQQPYGGYRGGLDASAVGPPSQTQKPCTCNDPPPGVTRPKNGESTRPPGWSCERHGQVI